MIHISIHTATLEDSLYSFARALGVPVEDGLLKFPEHAGVGTIRVIHLPNGLELLINDFQLLDDLEILRRDHASDAWILVCDEVTELKKLEMQVGEATLEMESPKASAIFLTNLGDMVSYSVSAGTLLRGIRVMLQPEWLVQYLQMDQLAEVLRRYASRGVADILALPIDTERRTLLEEIIQQQDSPTPLSPLYFQNRVMRVLEHFFSWLIESYAHRDLDMSLSKEDIRRVMEAEALLLHDFSVPAPTINELSRMVSVSSSKLKLDFKKVFGDSIYRYFQKKRMEKARTLLLTRTSTIREIGHELGYNNLSNFTIAFRKEFNMLPSEIIRPTSCIKDEKATR